MAICEYGYHESQQVANIDDVELLEYLDIINEYRKHPIIVRSMDYRIEGLFGIKTLYGYDVFVNLGHGERQLLYTNVDRDVVRAYLWGTVHGITQLNKE